MNILSCSYTRMWREKAQRAIFLLLAEQSIKKRAKVLLFFELSKFLGNYFSNNFIFNEKLREPKSAESFS